MGETRSFTGWVCCFSVCLEPFHDVRFELFSLGDGHVEIIFFIGTGIIEMGCGCSTLPCPMIQRGIESRSDNFTLGVQDYVQNGS